MASNPTWTVALFYSALRDNLQLRPGLAGVQIAAAPISRDKLQDEAIALIDAEADEEAAALGNNKKREVYIVEGVVWVSRRGEGDDVADLARDRAAEIFGEVEEELRENPQFQDSTDGRTTFPGGVFYYNETQTKNLRQAMHEGHRRAVIEFDIQITTKIGEATP